MARKAPKALGFWRCLRPCAFLLAVGILWRLRHDVIPLLGSLQESVETIAIQQRKPGKAAGTAGDPTSASRVLAHIRSGWLARIPLGPPGSSQYFNVWSAVPVLTHNGSSSPQLALVGSVKGGRDVAEAATRGQHYLRLSSGTTSLFSKHTGMAYQSCVSWFADLPPTEFDAWMDSRQEEACLEFQILDQEAHPVATIRGCHNPSLLPQPKSPHNFTLCYTTPPYLQAGKAEKSAFLVLPQSLVYHIRHGVDHAVVYLGLQHRESALRFLQPFMRRGWVSVVLVDRQPGDEVTMQILNQNDCLNRLKGRSRLYRGMDPDEVMYSTAWRGDLSWAAKRASLFDTAKSLLHAQSDYTYVRQYLWARPSDMFHQLLTNTSWRSKDFARTLPKTVVKPDCVAIDWIHEPVNCFGRRCNFRLGGPGGELEYAHVRSPQQAVLPAKCSQLRGPAPPECQPPEQFDLLFEEETPLLHMQLCSWMREVDLGCSPIDWLPVRT